MPMISELRDPSFTAPDRSRALSALHTARSSRLFSTSKTWAVVANIIDKLLSENTYHGSSVAPDSAPQQVPPSHATHSRETEPRESQKEWQWRANFSSKADPIPTQPFQTSRFVPHSMEMVPEFNTLSSVDLSHIQHDWVSSLPFPFGPTNKNRKKSNSCRTILPLTMTSGLLKALHRKDRVKHNVEYTTEHFLQFIDSLTKKCQAVLSA